MRGLLAPFLAIAWALVCLTAGGAAAQKTAPEIWLNPNSRDDWLQMWSDDAPWQNAASHVNVIGIASWWLNGGTDAQIRSIFDFAKRHHMKVEMETSMIAHDTIEGCGHPEGYSLESEIQAQVNVLKRLNLHIDIVTIDEPLGFGHYNSNGKCQFSVPDLVDRIVRNYNIIAAQSPDVQLVQIEPVPGITNFPDWRDRLSDFWVLMAQKTGKKIHAIQLDMGWDTPAWRQPLRDMYRFAHQHGIGLGFYVYGSGFAVSDAAWINQALQHIETVEGEMGIIPDQAVFASWSTFPKKTMPETSPTTLTWLIDRYFRNRAVVVGAFSGDGVRGKLLTEDGKPIANTTVNAYVPGVDFTQPLPVTVYQGTVPANAVYGLIGYRLNAECNCAGFNDVLVGLLQYQETQGGSVSYSWSFPFTRQTYMGGVIVDAEWVGGIRVNRVIVNPTQRLGANSSFFTVTPGAQFTFTVPASTIGGTGWFGYAMVLWFDQNHNGLPGKVTVIPDAGRRLMSTTTTAADGSFQVRKLPKVGPGSAPVSVQFPGDDNHRQATWTPLPH